MPGFWIEKKVELVVPVPPQSWHLSADCSAQPRNPPALLIWGGWKAPAPVVKKPGFLKKPGFFCVAPASFERLVCRWVNLDARIL
jgi:hypothetical protein